VCEVLEGPRLEFVDRITKHPDEAVVSAQNRSVGSHQSNAHGRIFERCPEPCLAIRKRAPRLNLLRPELREQQRAANFSIGLTPGHHGPAHPVGAVLVRELVFLLRQLLTGQHAGLNVAPALRDSGKDLVNRSANELSVLGEMVVNDEATRDG